MKLEITKLKCNIIICNKFKSRLLGFMFKTNIDYGLLFPNCNSIHTFFMKENIDVIMLDKNYNIIKCYENVHRNRIILPKRKVKHILELPAHYIKKNKLV